MMTSIDFISILFPTEQSKEQLKIINSFIYGMLSDQLINKSKITSRKNKEKLYEYKWELYRPVHSTKVERLIRFLQDLNYEKFAIRATEDNRFLDLIPNEKYDLISDSLGREQHNRWMNDKIQDGWRYGINFSLKNKMHPLLRPWYDLTDEEKQELKLSKDHLTMTLKSNNMNLITKNDLESLDSLIRKII